MGATQATIQRLTTADIAQMYGVDPKAVDAVRASMSTIANFAKLYGVPARALAAITGEEIRAAIEEPAAAAYATPEEGLAMLLAEEGGCVDVEEAARLYRRPDPVKPAAITDKVRK